MPRPPRALPFRRVGMDGKERRRDAGLQHRCRSALDRRVVGAVEAVEPPLALRRIDRRVAGTTAPSESRMMSVGSSSPRFGSIRRREKRVRIAGAFRRSASSRAERRRRRCRRRCGGRSSPRGRPSSPYSGGMTLLAWSTRIRSPPARSPSSASKESDRGEGPASAGSAFIINPRGDERTAREEPSRHDRGCRAVLPVREKAASAVFSPNRNYLTGSWLRVRGSE